MRWCRLVPLGGTIWDDLDDDQPWRDPAAEADRLQDRDTARTITRERFGALNILAAEAATTPFPPGRHKHIARPAWMLDDQLSQCRRRRTLNRALEPAGTTTEGLDWYDRHHERVLGGRP